MLNFPPFNRRPLSRLIPSFVQSVTALSLVMAAGHGHAALTVGTADTGQYGWRYGSNSHKVSYSDTFADAGEDLSLWTVGYDIDAVGEVEVWLNGAKLGDLKQTPNNGTKGTRLIIPASAQQAINTLEWRQTTPGWKWGMTKVLLRKVAGPVIAINPNVTETGRYGNKYGTKEHLGTVPMLFSVSESKPMALEVRGFDIDTTTEVDVVLDNNRIGSLKTTNNNQEGGNQVFDLGTVSSGSHTLEFRQADSVGYKYGVRDVLVRDVAGPGISLSIGTTDSGEYGNRFGSDEHFGALDATFVSEGSDLILDVDGYDIDDPNEVEVLLNGSPLATRYLSTGPNNGMNGGNSFSIPAAAQSSGVNTLTFRQAVSIGWKWGVSNIHLRGSTSGGSDSAGPRDVAACLATDATGVGQIVVTPGSDVKTIVDNAPEGAEFLVKAGTHRMTQTINMKNNQRMICESGATFNGSVQLFGTWTPDTVSGVYVYSGAPAEQVTTGQMQPGFAINSSLNDLFIDDELYLRVASKSALNNSQVTAYDGEVLYVGTFYQDGDKLYVRGNPNGKKVEMSSVGWAFYSAPGYGDNVVMENCTIEKYASPDLGAALTLKQTKGWTLRNVTSQYNHSGGLQGGSGTTVLCGDYSHNGQTGISTSYAADGPNIYSYADNLIVKGAEIAYNNWAHYDVQWHAGGSKFFETDGVIVEDSIIHDNLGVGLWSDFDVYTSVFQHNRIYNNYSRAIQIEASHTARVKYNQVQCNTRDPNFSLGYSWFWGSQIFAKNSPEVDISFNEVDVLHGQGIGVVDNNFRSVGVYGPQQALNNKVHDNTISYADVPVLSGDSGYYDYFFQRSGFESDGLATTGGPGALDCNPDSTMYHDHTQAEIDQLVAQCQAAGGFDATRLSSGNASYSNTYNYATNIPHFRIGGQSYTASNIPSGWETGSTFNIGSSPMLTNLCQ